MKRTFLK